MKRKEGKEKDREEEEAKVKIEIERKVVNRLIVPRYDRVYNVGTWEVFTSIVCGRPEAYNAKINHELIENEETF